MNSLAQLRKELGALGSEKKKKSSSRFFKTGEGQYGYGDKFIGVTLPEQRVLAKKFPKLTLADIEKLLLSKIHEERSVGLIILVNRYKKADLEMKKNIFDFYVEHIKTVNNWDLVDGSAPEIIGDFLLDKKVTLILFYAKSNNIWLRRIAMVATHMFQRAKKDNSLTFQVADLLLEDKNDLVQKAVGWMLRESGKRVSEKDLEKYLLKNYKKMGRTALRYAIERFDADRRREYLSGVV
jgi:3-methyladenine DNA glycosylase AlkD